VDEGDLVCGNYNQSTKKIRWWLPLDGESENRYCLRYDLQTRGFALQSASNVTAAATVLGPSSTNVTVTGDMYGDLTQLDVGYIDGAFGFEPKQTVSSWAPTTRTITVSGTPFPTSGDGLKGLPVLLLPAAGPPYEMLKVDSNTSSTLVLTAPPTLTPASSDLVFVGGIPLDLQSDFDYEQPELLKWLEGLTLSFEPDDTANLATEVWCGAGADGTDPSAYSVTDYADMNAETDGEHHFWEYTPRGRTLGVRFLAIGRGGPIRLNGFVAAIRAPAEAETEG